MMENEWFEISYINYDEVILHGQMRTEAGEQQVRKVLSYEEKDLVVDMNERHRREMNMLLKGFVS